jgi:hypothetical protein
MIDSNGFIQEHKDVVTGIWKFGPDVSPMSVGMFATEWLTEEDPNLLQLYCRKCSRDQYGIGFMYRFEGDSYKPFFHRMTDKLKRRFGNGFVGWDVSVPTWILK